MKLTLKAKEQTFKDFVLDSASKQIELLKSDIDTFKKMYHSDMTPRETMYLDEAIAEKKKQLSKQQALLRKYQKIRSSATAEEIKAAALKDKEALEAMRSFEKFKKPRAMTFAFWSAADSGKNFTIKFAGKATFNAIGNNSLMFVAQDDSFAAAIPVDAQLIQFNESTEQIYIKSKLGTYLIEW